LLMTETVIMFFPDNQRLFSGIFLPAKRASVV